MVDRQTSLYLLRRERAEIALDPVERHSGVDRRAVELMDADVSILLDDHRVPGLGVEPVEWLLGEPVAIYQ